MSKTPAQNAMDTIYDARTKAQKLISILEDVLEKLSYVKEVA